MFTKKRIIIIILILFLFVYTGCATIFKGSTEDVTVLSKPFKAKVYVDGFCP